MHMQAVSEKEGAYASCVVQQHEREREGARERGGCCGARVNTSDSPEYVISRAREITTTKRSNINAYFLIHFVW